MSRRWHPLLALVLSLSVVSSADAFNPRGRDRKAQKPPSAGPKTPRKPPTTPAAPKSEPQPSEPSSEALVERYTKIVLEQPGAPFPLQRLAELYRTRDGNLDKLTQEFEARAAQPGSQQYSALLALAGIYVQANRFTQAEQTYQAALQLSPKDPLGLLALGRLYDERGDKAKAKAHFEQALPLIQVGAEREQTLRLLMTLNLDTKDFARARELHRELVKRAKDSFFVRAELGRELLLRNHYAEAETELRDLVKASSGDHRATAPALRDLGLALTKQGKHDEALTVLKRALDMTRDESGLRREVLETMVEVYRGQEKLSELVALLEQDRSQDFQRLRLLAGLYEETGRIDAAIKTYRAALGRNKEDIEVRLKLVQLLQIQGELSLAIEEHKALIKAAPRNPDFVLQLSEAMLQQGDRKGALQQLQELERRTGNDEQTVAALVDFYERIGESEQAMRLLQRLADSGGVDPEHVIELGNRHYQAGDTDKAKATWKRVLVLVSDRARAQYMLGEVYLEHDLADLALEALLEASKLAPTERRYKKSLALALERTGSAASKPLRRERHEQARKLWEELLTGAGADHQLQQEARQHIVTLWSLQGALQARLRPLERNLAQEPPDLDAGRMLGEVYVRLRRHPDAERVLSKVTANAPGDISSHLRLERVLVLQRKLPEAILVLKKLAEAEPKRAREYYQRMSQYAAESYRDDEAIEYAARAVELSPDDAMGHRNLAEMYRKRQEPERAIAEYRKAIAKNDRLFPVYFELAEMLFGREEHEEADRLLRRVMRAAVDEDLVARATRLSMQINLAQGSLETLEQDLLPIALSNPQRPVYRRLLVELYGALAFPLVQKAASNDNAVREEARAELRRIGQRAVKPLLDALSDPRDAQQRVAIELLTVLENKSAAVALYTYATGEAEPDLRVRAMIAAGAPADEGLLPRFEKLLSDDGRLRVDEGDPVSIAAVWGLGRLSSPAAQRLKLRLLEAEAPSARALSALSLGLSKVKAAEAPLKRILLSEEQGPVSRAAAAYALAEMGNTDATRTLLALAESGDDRLRAAALTALARGSVREAVPRLADAIVYGKPALRQAAIAAASVLDGAPYQRHPDPLRTPPARIDLDPILQNFNASVADPAAAARALILLGDALAEACRSAVQSSEEQARAVADALLARQGQPAFGELTLHLEQLDAATRTRAEATAEQIAAAVLDPFVALVEHPSAKLRATAIEFLATRSEPEARAALVQALTDPDSKVQRAALVALGEHPNVETLPSIIPLLESSQPWGTRLAAARMLTAFGRLPAAQKVGAGFENTVKQLSFRAQEDDYSLVREAALQALWALSKSAAKPILERVKREDPEPRVAASAAQLLAEAP